MSIEIHVCYRQVFTFHYNNQCYFLHGISRFEGLEISQGCWVKLVAQQEKTQAYTNTSLIPALFSWFGISLAPWCTVRHARPLAQSYQARSCLNPKRVFPVSEADLWRERARKYQTGSTDLSYCTCSVYQLLLCKQLLFINS